MAEAKKEETKIRAYQVSISGSYRTAERGKYVDYIDVKGVIPYNPVIEYCESCIMKRYAPMWIFNDKRYRERVTTMREVYIDVMEETEAAFSCIGKEIRTLTFDEMQDVATLKGLRQVPLYKKGSVRQAQMVTYAAFSEKVLGIEVPYKDEGFRIAEQPDIFVDPVAEFNIATPFSVEQSIELEQESKGMGKGKDIDRGKLEKLAQDRGIIFNPAMSDDKLQSLVFNA